MYILLSCLGYYWKFKPKLFLFWLQHGNTHDKSAFNCFVFRRGTVSDPLTQNLDAAKSSLQALWGKMIVFVHSRCHPNTPAYPQYIKTSLEWLNIGFPCSSLIDSVNDNLRLLISILSSSARWHRVDQMWFLRNGQFWYNPIKHLVEWHRENERDMDSETAEERFGFWMYLCVWHGFPSLRS